MFGRYDYIKYDEESCCDQAAFKTMFMLLDEAIDQLEPGRAKSLAQTKLEEAYMWIGKAIRDEQLNRSGNNQLQEERNHS